MRIRKHAKFSPLAYATSSLNPGIALQTHVCQLNQSPWDVMSFSPPSTPPPPQVNECCVSAGNGSSGNCISVFEREFNSWLRLDIRNAAHQVDDHKVDEQQRLPLPENKQIILCCKTDGKSWRCRREAAKDNSQCAHHSTLIKSYSNSTHNASKKMIKPAKEAPRRTRPKKVSSNAHEFYYYSGFGPRWGKKRSETCKNNESCIPKNVGDERKNEMETRVRAEDFDYSEYEDEEDDNKEVDGENRENMKKRIRKPIKARSLKSLINVM